MFYRWRYAFISCICLLIVGTTWVGNEWLFTLPMLPKSTTNIYTDQISLQGIFYDEQQKILYITEIKAEQYAIYEHDVKLQHVKAIIQNLEYQVYFLKAILITNTNIFIKEHNKDIAYVLLLSALPKINNRPNYFLTEDNYFIRSDTTYICNDFLQKQKRGTCHKESYYINFSDL